MPIFPNSILTFSLLQHLVLTENRARSAGWSGATFSLTCPTRPAGRLFRGAGGIAFFAIFLAYNAIFFAEQILYI